MISKIIQKVKDHQEDKPEGIIKKYIGTSENLTSFDKMLKDTYEEGKLYPASVIVESFKGSYQDTCEQIRAVAEETAKEEKKQSLINFKEYLEEIIKMDCFISIGLKLKIVEDIKELTKMIEAYSL